MSNPYRAIVLLGVWIPGVRPPCARWPLGETFVESARVIAIYAPSALPGLCASDAAALEHLVESTDIADEDVSTAEAWLRIASIADVDDAHALAGAAAATFRALLRPDNDEAARVAARS